MTGGNGKLQIVRTWTDPAADTGEGTNYECADGSRWHDDYEPIAQTGSSTGRRVGNIITPD